MYYAPHILELRTVPSPVFDEVGREVVGETSESWMKVCRCRLDKNSTKKFEDENGRLYIPKFHIVCEGHVSVGERDFVRVLSGGNVIGEGEVYLAKIINSLNYSELWV